MQIYGVLHQHINKGGGVGWGGVGWRMEGGSLAVRIEKPESTEENFSLFHQWSSVS